jgi:uracil-DNA glycosylase
MASGKRVSTTPDLFPELADDQAAAQPSPPPRLRAWNPEQWPVAPDWQPTVQNFLQSPVAQSLGAHIQQRLLSGASIYPPHPFRALDLTPLSQVRVVILGQDPYHGPGQAEGLAFSVPAGIKPPPSLRNIFKELQREGFAPPQNGGSLQAWAEQGVLLLNTCLTVENGQPASHAKRGWEVLTDTIIQACSNNQSPKVFLLWGAHAQAKRPLIDESRHMVLCANHPSPLSASRPPMPFMGCSHFALANAFLAQHGHSTIDWSRERFKLA